MQLNCLKKHWGNYTDLKDNMVTEKTMAYHRELISVVQFSPTPLDVLRSELHHGANTLSLDLERILLPPLRGKLEFMLLLSFKCNHNFPDVSRQLDSTFSLSSHKGH